jgi:pSer/pThr/pTyr-binding forkhead associated (FHA) protein
MIKYSVYFNGELSKVYELDEPVIFIGRLPENNIPISNMGVSRRHVKIELDQYNAYTLTDLNSLNGTLVNGKKVKKVTLCHGDKITIGKHTIVYEDYRSESAPHMETIVAEFRPEDLHNAAAAAAQAQAAIAAQALPPRLAPSRPPAPAAPAPIQPPQTPVQPMPAPIAAPAPIPPIAAPAPIPPLAAPIAPAGPADDADPAAQSGAVLIETSGHIVYKLDSDILSIGSDEEDDVYATGFGISKGYAVIERHDGEYRLSAQKVMSKIKVNGKSVRTHNLEHRDRIEIGSNTFRFMENG